MRTITKVKVRNMESPRTGKPVPNQFVINTPEGTYFQSYETVIAFRDNKGEVTLDPDWNYSVTTAKYRGEFLGENTAITRKKLSAEMYAEQELNE